MRTRALIVMLVVCALGMAQTTHAQQVTEVSPETLTPRERALLDRVERLEQRLATLEAERAGASTTNVASNAMAASATPAAQPVAQPAQTPAPTAAETTLTPEDKGVLGFFRDTTFNVTIDGYYGYNFNKPIGGVNLLRPYDVTSNSFNLNQAAVVIEQTPDVDGGRRYGMRLDLQWGQATETVQGSASNELRPQVWRNVLQAYGTYVVPVGKGATVDFGKWVSALGVEGNYTKDQINYSRSYWFNFLPFYHEGLRVTYPVSDKITATYWLVNGAQQTEDTNGFKSQALILNLKPAKSVSWNVNYYTGLEGRSYVANLNPGFPTIPSQPGLPTSEFEPAPRGRTHIFDTYATWNATDKLTFVGEFDYAINRFMPNSAPSHVMGGAGYVRYQLDPHNAIAARGEYLSDRGGLFTGATQSLYETTLTYEYRFAEGLLTRIEWRRDASNQPFFLTQTPGVFKTEQNTATIGLVWWMGRKQGSW